MNCPICGAKYNSPEELMAHVKEHGIEIDPDFMNNLMKGLGNFFADMFSGKSDMSSDAEDNKEIDPSLLFGNMMEQLMKTFTESLEGLQNIDADTQQGMPNPFAMMMKNMFDQSIQTEPEAKDETPSPGTNEDDAMFKENSIEIPFSSDDDEKKKDKKESDE